MAGIRRQRLSPTEGIVAMSDQTSPDHELRDPSTPAERLAAIASSHPELGADVARHPNAYDGLLDWLSRYGDDAARAAVAERRQTGTGGAEAAPEHATASIPAGEPVVPAADPVVPSSAATVPAAAASPAAEGDAPAGEPRRASKKGLTIGLIAGGLVVVLGGGTVWAVNAIFGGEKSPEAAAEKVFEGALSLDPIALYTAMAPSEAKPLKDALEQLNDLPTSSEEDAKDVQETLQAVLDAIDVTTEGLEYRADSLMEGVSRVSLVNGSLEIDADTAELGDALRDFLEVSMRYSLEQSGYYSEEEIDELLDEQLDEQVDYMIDSLADELPIEVDFAETWGEQLDDKQSRDIDEDDALAGQGYPFSVIAVDEGGWYTSPILTVTDLIVGEQLIASGATYGDALIEAERFGSPEDAAHGLADGVEAFASRGDYEALAATLPVAERRALSLYGPALDDMSSDEGASLSDFDVEIVKDDGLTGLLISDLDILDNGEVVGTYDHPCFEDAAYGGQSCIDDIPALKTLGLDEALPIAIKEDGGWFVSPTATVGNALAIVTARLSELIEDDELDKLFEF